MEHSKVLCIAKSSEKSLRPFIPAEWREGLLADLSGPDLKVYLAYWAHANGDDLAWPSLRSLCKTTGYGLNTVKEARRALIAKGLLIAIKQERKGGRFGKKVFRVSTVGHKVCHGTAAPSTVAPSTVAPSTVGHKVCQEGSPSEGSPVKGKQVAEAEAAAAPPVREEEKTERFPKAWEVIGIKPCGPLKFIRAWEDIYGDSLTDERLSVTMEMAIQHCQENGIRIPPPFFSAKRAIEKREGRDSFPSHPIPDWGENEVSRVAGPRGVREEMMR